MNLSLEAKKGVCGFLLVLVAVAIVILFVRYGLLPVLQGNNLSDMVKLPLLAIIGVIVLLVCLAAVSVAFALFNLSDKTQALALPEGSVRAVIALSLVVLFAIMTIFLFRNLGEPVTAAPGLAGAVTDLTEQQKVQFLNDNKNVLSMVVVPSTIKKDDKTEDRYKIEYRERADEAARQRAKEDFAKQLLVLIGTLLTAVSSFYFGTRAVASQADTRLPATLGNVKPPAVRAGSGTTDFEISGNNLDLIREVKFVSGSDELVGTDATSNAQIVKCKVSFSKVDKPGQWDVVATDANQRVYKLQGAVKVTDAVQASNLDPRQVSKANWPAQFRIDGKNLDQVAAVNVRQEGSQASIAASITKKESALLIFMADQSKLTVGKWNVEIVDDKGVVLAAPLTLEVNG